MTPVQPEPFETFEPIQMAGGNGDNTVQIRDVYEKFREVGTPVTVTAKKKVFGKVSGADFYKVKDGLKDFPLVS